jgi:hypothetical protein
MNQDRASGGSLLVIRGVLFGLLVFGLVGCQLFDDPVYETPAGVRLEGVYSDFVLIAWDAVPDAVDYIVRLNGAEAAVVTGAACVIPGTVYLGSYYTVSAGYGGTPRAESHPSARLEIKNIAPRPPAPAGGEDKSTLITSYQRAPGIPALAEWYETSLPPLGVDYYIIPVVPAYTYSFRWDDGWSGSSTKTLNIRVYAFWSETNTPIGSIYGVDNGYNSVGFTVSGSSADSTGFVVLRVEAYTPGNTGTYGIAYTYQ